MNAQELLATPGLAPVLTALPEARLVGGCVRDLLAGRPIADIDLATPDPPEKMMAALERCGLRTLPTGLAHGTITAISAGRPFEITTLRRDEETDGRHARVAWTDDFMQDAARRDFTINAMSLSRDGTLHDYFGGKDDLIAGTVRFVGEARRRVAEDFLRILRFFRFFARYGTPPADQAAVAAIIGGRTGLVSLSAERVWSELKRILAAPDPRHAVALMEKLGVLPLVLPEGADPAALNRLVAAGAPPDPLLRLAALFTGDIDPLAERLKLSNAEQARLAMLRTGPSAHADDDDDTLRRLLAEEPAELLVNRLWLRGDAPDTLRTRIENLPRPVFPLGGRDAMILGAAPGPHIGEALARVRDWWLQGGCTATHEDARQKLAEALAAYRRK